MILMDRQLPKQRGGNGIGLIALMRLGKEGALDLRGAQGDVTDDLTAGRVADDIGAGDLRRLVCPGPVAEPLVQGFPSTIEAASVVTLGKRTGRRYRRHVGSLLASSLRPAISSAG